MTRPRSPYLVSPAYDWAWFLLPPSACRVFSQVSAVFPGPAYGGHDRLSSQMWTSGRRCGRRHDEEPLVSDTIGGEVSGALLELDSDELLRLGRVVA